jgi:flagellar basal-body rod modification protein FlgD
LSTGSRRTTAACRVNQLPSMAKGNKAGGTRAGREEVKKMAAMAGILNHQMTAGQALTGQSAAPMASGTGGTNGTSSAGNSSDSSGNSATISANDFLTLLVTEMQNQDPTANTDPNEYINQLVSVNSLEQLIDINQNLSTAVGSSPTGSGGSSPSPVVVSSASSLTGKGASGQLPAAAHPAAAPVTARSLGHTASNPAIPAAGATRAPGNLSVPEAGASANRVGHALNGQSRPHSMANRLTGAQ